MPCSLRGMATAFDLLHINRLPYSMSQSTAVMLRLAARRCTEVV